jgi:Family of unknown function (DUF5686)/CarboxypepD_reg-like domain
MCLLTLPGFAQVTNISGKVTDALTNEPIPFATVVMKGMQAGTNTDMDGNYRIITSTPSDTLICTLIGYKTVGLRIRKGQVQTINFSLKATLSEIQEVEIKAGENPANIIVRNIIKHKDENDPSRLESYQYEVYNKVEFDLTNIGEKFKNKKLLKPFAFIWDNIDSTETNSKPFLPFFISETLSEFYFRNNPKNKKEIINASKISGLENASVTQFLGDMYQRINIYQNYIDVFNKAFVSPISDLGLLYYRYYLLDSAVIDNQWCYKLKFKPRRPQELTFTGDFWVHDTTWAVKKIQMRIAQDANINWIDDMAIVQEYKYIDGKQWMQSKDMLVIDFAAKEDGMGFIGRKSTSYKNFRFNHPINDAIFAGTENIVVVDDALNRTVDFWQEARHDSLAEREKKIYYLVDTIKTLPAFKSYVDIITLFFTGYKEIGNFELGPYYTFFSFNAVEGARFRFGGRTSDNFSTRLQLSGYLAYGVKDEKFKYGGGVKYMISNKPRQFAGLSYKKDVQQLGQSDNAFQDDNILSSLFRRSPANKLTEIEQQKGWYEIEWIPGFSNKITLTHNDHAPLGNLNYSYFTNEEKTTVKNSIRSTEISLYTRFLYREKFVSGKADRISIGSAYPTVQLNYVVGLKDFLKSDFEYQKVIIKIDDQIKIKPFGYTYYVLQAGRIWGTIPYPLLEVHPGNESYFYDYAAFNMMNYFEFVSDQYISLFATHHFDGFFLDKIPLMRKLKWREIVAIKAISGSLSDANREILTNPNAFSSLTKPYTEVSAGVENILKIIRVDFIWRLTYIDELYKTTYKERFGESSITPTQFGFRASLQLVF